MNDMLNSFSLNNKGTFMISIEFSRKLVFNSMMGILRKLVNG